jgi:hypothetical protein
MAVLGPDSPAKGERENSAPLISAQIAATVAQFLGYDYVKASPQAAAPIADFFFTAR